LGRYRGVKAMKTCPLYIQSAIPHITEYGVSAQVMNSVSCSGPDCAWWAKQGGCAVNPEPEIHLATEDPTPPFDLYRMQLKRNVEILLEEKTGWGRVELKKRLVDLIEKTGLERTELFNIHSEKDEDLPF